MKFFGNRSQVSGELLWIVPLFAVCAFVLWLPVFPTGDGPVHLYLAHIYLSLVLHPSSRFDRFYSIRHIVQPYCLTYYSIGLLEKVLTPDWAEKVIICIAILLQGCGYRFIARGFGRNGNLVALFIIPLLISFSLGAGFVSFCISVGLAYFALGVWIRMDGRPNPRLLGIFALLTVLILLTHPIPLLVLAGYIAGDIALQGLARRPRSLKACWSSHKGQWMALCMVALAIVGPALMTLGKTTSMSSSLRDFHPFYIARGALALKFLILCNGTFAADIFYRIAIYIGFLLAIFVCGRKLIRNVASHTLDFADRFFLLSVLFFALIPLLPLSIGGGFYFSQRMIGIAWPLVIAPLAAIRFAPDKSRYLALSLIALSALSIFVWAKEIVPVARKTAVLGSLPITPGSQGVFLETSAEFFSRETGFTYPVTAWAGVRALLTRNAVLLNTPWMDQPVIPLVPSRHSELLLSQFSEQSSDPRHLYAAIHDRRIRAKILAESQFILFQDTVGETPVRQFLQTIHAGSLVNWKCQDGGFYVLCEKSSAASPVTVQGSTQKETGANPSRPSL